MKWNNHTLLQVQSLGLIGCEIADIIVLLKLTNKDQFLSDIEDPDNDLHIAYLEGKVQGKYLLEKEMYDAAKSGCLEANEKLYKRIQENKIRKAIYEKFAV